MTTALCCFLLYLRRRLRLGRCRCGRRRESGCERHTWGIRCEILRPWWQRRHRCRHFALDCLFLQIGNSECDLWYLQYQDGFERYRIFIGHTKRSLPDSGSNASNTMTLPTFPRTPKMPTYHPSTVGSVIYNSTPFPPGNTSTNAPSFTPSIFISLDKSSAPCNMSLTRQSLSMSSLSCYNYSAAVSGHGEVVSVGARFLSPSCLSVSCICTSGIGSSGALCQSSMAPTRRTAVPFNILFDGVPVIIGWRQKEGNV